MKRMILILVVGLGMFGASAGASWYLRKAETAHNAEHAADSHGGEPFRHASDTGERVLSKSPGAVDPQAPPAARANATATPESLAQFHASLRQKEDSLKNREQSFLVRHKHLDVIYEDLRKERKTLDELRAQVGEEMKALTEKWESLEKKASELDKKKKDIGKQEQEVKQTIFEVEGVEQKSIKKMAETFNAMDAETAGELLEQMANAGKMEMAAKIMATMQERQAARVMAAMQDRTTVIQLLDKMKGLKRPTAP